MAAIATPAPMMVSTISIQVLGPKSVPPPVTNATIASPVASAALRPASAGTPRAADSRRGACTITGEPSAISAEAGARDSAGVNARP